MHQLVELRDVFPTLAELAGIPLASDAKIDGASLLPLLLEPENRRRSALAGWRGILMLELAMCNAGWNWAALTDGRFKYVRHLASGHEQLFDLSTDPHELHDRAHDDATTCSLWRERLAAEFQRERRGRKWVLPNGTIPLQENCSQYELIDVVEGTRIDADR